MDALNTYLESIREKYHLPALAVAVSQEGHADIVAAVGVRKTNEPDNHVTIDDPFHFGSCGKAITAAVIHKLVEEGKLKLDTTLAQIFPDAELNPKYKEVTVANILTHSAGLPNIPGGVAIPNGQVPDAVTSALANASGFPALKEQLKDLPKFERGTFHYSNFGYALLGDIAAQVSGKPFEQLVREDVFTPLNMKTAGFGIPTDKNAPWGHFEGEPVHDDGVPKELVATGSMHASVGDWLKFLKYEVTQPGLQQPHYEVPVAYPVKGGTEAAAYVDSGFLRRADGSFTKEGSNGFNNAKEWLLPDKKAAFVIVTNSDSTDSEPERQAINEVEAYVRGRVIGGHGINRVQDTGIPKTRIMPPADETEPHDPFALPSPVTPNSGRSVPERTTPDPP